MKKIINTICLCGFVLSSCLIGCERSETTSENDDTDTTVVVKSLTPVQSPVYDPSKDPLIVGAKFSKTVGDTLDIKMYELTLKPGESAALHTHPDHTFYILQGGKMEVTFQGQGAVIMDLKEGMGGISGPASDAVKNVGKTTIKMLIHDIYRPRHQ